VAGSGGSGRGIEERRSGETPALSDPPGTVGDEVIDDDGSEP
jgi:hypothetical protein